MSKFKKEVENNNLKLKGKLDELTIEISNNKTLIFELEQKIWKLENPFKYKLGDTVIYITSMESPIIFSNGVRNHQLFKKEKEKIYKIISCEYRLKNFKDIYPRINYKAYEIFCCETNEKFTVQEDQIKLKKDE